jgi:hypothetical protein
VQDARPSGPWAPPFVGVEVDSVDTGDRGEGGQGGLFGGLGLEKLGCGGGEEDSDGEGGGRMAGEEGGDYEWEFDRCDRAGGAKQEVVFVVVKVVGSSEDGWNWEGVSLGGTLLGLVGRRLVSSERFFFIRSSGYVG